MFQLLPVVETILLPFLPVEMWVWVAILRLLDPKSLLAGVRTHKPWLSVCRGDPILRRRMRLALEEETHLARKFMMDPRMSVQVARSISATKYGTNIQKVVTTVSKPAAMELPKLEINDSKRKKTKKLSKGKTSSRFCPYRL